MIARPDPVLAWCMIARPDPVLARPDPVLDPVLGVGPRRGSVPSLAQSIFHKTEKLT